MITILLTIILIPMAIVALFYMIPLIFSFLAICAVPVVALFLWAQSKIKAWRN